MFNLFKKKKLIAPSVPNIVHYAKQELKQSSTWLKVNGVVKEQFFKVSLDGRTQEFLGEEEITKEEHNEGILRYTKERTREGAIETTYEI